jgi:hypothetical protein
MQNLNGLFVSTTRNILSDGAETGFLSKIQFLCRLKKELRGACGQKLAMEQHYI